MVTHSSRTVGIREDMVSKELYAKKRKRCKMLNRNQMKIELDSDINEINHNHPNKQFEGLIQKLQLHRIIIRPSNIENDIMIDCHIFLHHCMNPILP